MVNNWNNNIYLVGGDWNHGILNDFPHIGNGKSSQLTFTPSFFRGVGMKKPTSSFLEILTGFED